MVLLYVLYKYICIHRNMELQFEICTMGHVNKHLSIIQNLYVIFFRGNDLNLKS